jgi:drug/metabolite transporter (DMT)-like permease
MAHGVLFALLTAACWAVSPMFMASIGRRIGAWHTNLLRILLAELALLMVILPTYLLLHGSVAWPSAAQCGWIILSGLGGMAVGDVFFYEALVVIGPRRAIKLNTLAPVWAIALGYVINREALPATTLAGAALVIAAVVYATFRQTSVAGGAVAPEPPRMGVGGFLLGLGAAFCTGLGSVLARRAFQISDPPLDPILATTLRVGIAAATLWAFALATGSARQAVSRLTLPGLRGRLAAGVLLGPLGGMLCYLLALQSLRAGLVSTLVATSPLLTMPILAVRYRLRLGWDIVAATVLAVAGVWLIHLSA